MISTPRNPFYNNSSNINTKKGSTQPELFQQYTKEHIGEYDIGLMFDGDVDRQILVRPSGTEQLLRVMTEAKTNEICDRVVSEIARLIQKSMV